MEVVFPRPSLWHQVAWRLKPVDREALACAGFDRVAAGLSDQMQAFVHDSYPRNHTYSLIEDRLVPSRKLAVRVAGLARCYPTPLRSLVDLSCSKGFFVFHAAAQPACERALGIDLDNECLRVCGQFHARFSQSERVRFSRLTLPELAERIGEFGGPFQTALLINTYQYLLFGSTIAPAIGHEHRQIFRLLRRVCSGRLVFHNRLRLSDLQSNVWKRAAREGTARLYHPRAIRQAAEEFFHVTTLRKWLGRPVWLLDAK